MLAKDLKQIVKKQDSVTIRVIATPAPQGQGDMSDFGASVAGISTYLSPGMMADITDVCTMPPVEERLLDAKPYLDAVMPGHIYFVFHHGPYLAHNEQFASQVWENDDPQNGEVGQGTAVQTGCYTGYDMLGFPANEDMSKLFAIAEKV